MTRVFEDVACTVCGCVCDDLRLTVADNRVVRAERACVLSEPWLLAQNVHQPPEASTAEGAIDYQSAIALGSRWLARARSPLIYGLSRSSTEGQRAATALADRIGATIDTTASRCHAPSILALQHAGESTCSLGEIRNRADLVVYWGSNPTESHPRHFERYAVDPPGQFVPRGRTDRTLVVVDILRTPTAEAADLFIPVAPDGDFEALWTLRGLVRGMPPRPGAATGASLALLEELAERMRSCRCGVIFFGLGLTKRALGHRTVEALLRLVTDLNAHTRFHARRMRVPGDVTGADSVLCWQTGYPFGVSLARDYPRYNPGEFSGGDMLERGEVDACLVVGSESLARFSSAALRALSTIPTIVLDYPGIEAPLRPTLHFTTAVYGVHRRGTAYRMDEIPIPLRPVLTSPYRADHEVLGDLLAGVDSVTDP